jgi:hypothetical protein
MRFIAIVIFEKVFRKSVIQILFVIYYSKIKYILLKFINIPGCFYYVLLAFC